MENTTAVDALIVRNIGDIETAIHLATESLDKTLWAEMGNAIVKAVSHYDWPSTNDPKECDVQFSINDKLWQDKNGKKHSVLFFIDEIPKYVDDLPYSYIASAVSDNRYGSRLGLFFYQEILEVQAFKRFIKNNAKLWDTLITGDFSETKNHAVFRIQKVPLYFPLAFDKEALAKAFEEEDFEAALAPIKTAVDAVAKNMEAFQKLVVALRDEEARS